MTLSSPGTHGEDSGGADLIVSSGASLSPCESHSTPASVRQLLLRSSSLRRDAPTAADSFSQQLAVRLHESNLHSRYR